MCICEKCFNSIYLSKLQKVYNHLYEWINELIKTTCVSNKYNKLVISNYYESIKFVWLLDTFSKPWNIIRLLSLLKWLYLSFIMKTRK